MKPQFLAARISRCKTLNIHVVYDVPLGGVTSTPTNSFFVNQHLRNVINVSPRRYAHDFRSLAVPTPPLKIRILFNKDNQRIWMEDNYFY